MGKLLALPGVRPPLQVDTSRGRIYSVELDQRILDVEGRIERVHRRVRELRELLEREGEIDGPMDC